MAVLTFINQALTRTGNSPVTTLNNGTPGGDIAGQNYDNLVKTALSGYPWRWATKTAALANITGEPDPPWTYAYQLPADLMHLRVVTVDGAPIEYEQQFNKVLCDYGTDTDVIAKYIWNVPEAYWPGTFAEGITQYLEAMFLRGIGERFEEASDREKAARATMQLAKLEDSKRATARNPFNSPTLDARRGILAPSRVPWR